MSAVPAKHCGCQGYLGGKSSRPRGKVDSGETGNISCQKEGKQVAHPTEAGKGARGRGNPGPLEPPKGAPPRGRRGPTKNKSSLRTKKELHKETPSGILCSAKSKTWEKLMELVADNSIPT